MLRIYAINLDHRSDRWLALQANAQAHGLAPAAIRRWSAVADPDFGALGCAKSHVAVLAHFLTADDAPYALVLEDDFEFLRPFGELLEAVNGLNRQALDWDVLLLMGTAVLALPPQAGGVARVLESQSAAAYLFSRRYAAQLLGCFAEGLPHMEALRATPARPLIAHRHAVDQAWKALQRRDRWFIFSPAFGRQRPGFSDIERREVDYAALTYGLPPAQAGAPPGARAGA
jgi:GR25 family glycosyltransferase involved in LPS biosynthesis